MADLNQDGIDESDDADAAQALALADEHDQAAQSPTPGLEGINVDQVSQNVAAAGQPPAVQPAGAVVPGAPPVAPAAGPTTPAAPPVVAPAAAQPQAQPVPDDTEKAKAATDLGAPPARPKLTGDQTKDVQSNLEWSRQLTDYQTALERKSGEIARRDAEVNDRRAQREAEAERQAAAQRQAEQQAYQAQRAARQQAIDASVAEKAAAYQALKGGDKPSFAEGIAGAVAIALGSVGQGLMLAGHVAGAKNEGLEAVKRQIETDHARRVERYKAASDATLEARYGLKDAYANHRAALADLDADRAAKYRLIAAEAAQQLRQNGASDQDVKTNAVVVASLKEAAKSEDAIQAREEATQVHRETAAATNKLAEAHLGLAERTLDATNAQRSSTNYEHGREFDLRQQAQADQRAAVKENRDIKLSEAEEQRILRDPNTGKPMGMTPSSRITEKLAEQLAQNQIYQDKIEALAQHFEKNGHILNPLSDAYKERESLIAEVQAQGRKVSGIQASDAGQKLEHEMIGGSGLGYHRSADPKVLRDLAARAEKLTMDKMRAALSPLPKGKEFGESPVAPRAPAESPHQDLLDLADKADRGGKAPAPTRSLVVNGKTVHYDAAGNRLP